MILNLTLLSGAGNTFHICHDFRDIKAMPQLTRDICKKIPADGVVFLEPSLDRKFIWNFFNNDGSEAEMCGNATRCVGYYVENVLHRPLREIDLKTISGWVRIQFLGKNLYQVQMPVVQIFSHSKFFYCNTGVPHIIWPIDDFDQYKKYKEQCRELRFHPDFAPQGTNVTLIAIDVQNKQTVRAVSYERGVEDFTLACGTGSIATALYMHQRHQQHKTTVEMPGGTLNIDLSDLKKPIMVGSVDFLKEYKYEHTS